MDTSNRPKLRSVFASIAPIDYSPPPASPPKIPPSAKSKKNSQKPMTFSEEAYALFEPFPVDRELRTSMQDRCLKIVSKKLLKALIRRNIQMAVMFRIASMGWKPEPSLPIALIFDFIAYFIMYLRNDIDRKLSLENWILLLGMHMDGLLFHFIIDLPFHTSSVFVCVAFILMESFWCLLLNDMINSRTSKHK
jgi:hypothetical protein